MSKLLFFRSIHLDDRFIFHYSSLLCCVVSSNSMRHKVQTVWVRLKAFVFSCISWKVTSHLNSHIRLSSINSLPLLLQFWTETLSLMEYFPHFLEFRKCHRVWEEFCFRALAFYWCNQNEFGTFVLRNIDDSIYPKNLMTTFVKIQFFGMKIWSKNPITAKI